jgi:hypothetical protein
MTCVAVGSYAPLGTETDIHLSYPYARPEGSFLTDGAAIVMLPSDPTEFQVEVNERLKNADLPLLHERQPIVSYGANSNPVRLAEKMSAFSVNGAPPELQVVPNLSARIPDTAVVWHGKPGQRGGTFAELYKGVETTGQEAICHIAFLTPQQLALMHVTEGVTYHLVPIDALGGKGNERLKVLAYVAGNSTVLLKDGQPVKVKRARETPTETSMTAEEAVDYMLASSGDDASNARELVAQMASLSLTERKARQQVISGRLGELGLNKDFRYPCAAGSFLGRADLNTAPGVYHLAEQVVESLRPTSPELRQTHRDIAVRIRERAHDELNAYLSSTR